MSDFTAEQTVARYREWVDRNGHYRCTCGEKLADHFADLDACATNVECPGFNLDPDPLVNKFDR
jgi:hypothetical protein